MKSINEDPVQILREVCPENTEEQIQEIADTLDKYLETCLQVYERVRNDPKLYAEFQALLEEERRKRIEREINRRLKQNWKSTL